MMFLIRPKPDNSSLSHSTLTPQRFPFSTGSIGHEASPLTPLPTPPSFSFLPFPIPTSPSQRLVRLSKIPILCTAPGSPCRVARVIPTSPTPCQVLFPTFLTFLTRQGQSLYPHSPHPVKVYYRGSTSVKREATPWTCAEEWIIPTNRNYGKRARCLIEILTQMEGMPHPKI